MRPPTLDELGGESAHRHLARLRTDHPVAWVPALGAWLVTGRREAVAVLHDPASFTVDDPRFSTAQVVGRSMLSTDGDEHARHRRPFADPFRRREVRARFAGSVTDDVGRFLERVAASDSTTADLRAGLAGPLAAATVARALALDGDDDAVVDRLLGWYRDIVDSVAGVAAGRPTTEAGDRAMAALREALLHDTSAVPGLTDDEMVANAAVIMFGGIETTEGMILNVLWHVLGDHSASELVAGDDEAAARAVEESLRLEPAAAVVDRYATAEVELGGVTIEQGALVVVSLAGANRDPGEFPDPDRFDLRRPNLRRQLAFAAGPHVCLGMELARLEAITALQRTLRRFPRLQLADDAPAPRGLVFRKPDRLPVSWT